MLPGRGVAALLWAAGRPCPDSAAVRCAAGALEPATDGARVAALAAVHRTTGLVWRSLAAVGATGVLGDAEAGMRDLATVLQLEALTRLPQALSLAVEPLTAAGLEPVVLKGPALAARYPAPGLRPMDDIDVLLPRRHHGAAMAALARAGWTVRRPGARDRYDTVLAHPAVPTLPLELHYGLQSFYERASRIDVDALWHRRIPVRLGGVGAYGLAAEDELLMLAAHAAKPFHTYLRLIWAVDLAVAVGRSTDQGDTADGNRAEEHQTPQGAEGERVKGNGVDWRLLVDRAASWRCRTALAVGLQLAARLGAAVPAAVVEELAGTAGPRWRERALAGLLDESWPVVAVEGASSSFHLRFALADTTWRRLVLAAGAAYQMDAVERVTWPAVAAARAVRRMRVLAAADPAEVAPVAGVTGAAGSAPAARSLR